MRGYQLIEKLRAEADEVAMENRAELMRDAANEIQKLIEEYKELANELERIKRQ